MRVAFHCALFTAADNYTTRISLFLPCAVFVSRLHSSENKIGTLFLSLPAQNPLFYKSFPS